MLAPKGEYLGGKYVSKSQNCLLGLCSKICNKIRSGLEIKKFIFLPCNILLYPATQTKGNLDLKDAKANQCSLFDFFPFVSS